MTTLDISMDNILGMKIFKALEGLFYDAFDLSGGKWTCFNVTQKLVLHVFED